MFWSRLSPSSQRLTAPLKSCNILWVISSSTIIIIINKSNSGAMGVTQLEPTNNRRQPAEIIIIYNTRTRCAVSLESESEARD